MRGAEAIDEYIALPQQEAFDIEYWLLEEAKLQAHARGEGTRAAGHRRHRRRLRHRQGNRAPPREGRRAHRLRGSERGRRARPPRRKSPTNTASASASPAAASPVAVRPSASLATSPTAPASARCSTRSRWPTAASTPSASPPASSCRATPRGHIPDDKWALTFGINVTGSYLVADEAAKTWKEQGLRGNSRADHQRQRRRREKGHRSPTTPRKAAANHLVRELAIELAPLVRVNGVAPATVVQGSAMFPRDRVIGSLAKYNIPYTDDEATDSLVDEARAVLRRPHADQSRRSRPPTRPRPTSSWSATASARPPARSSPWTAACTRRSCGKPQTGCGSAKLSRYVESQNRYTISYDISSFRFDLPERNYQNVTMIGDLIVEDPEVTAAVRQAV